MQLASEEERVLDLGEAKIQRTMILSARRLERRVFFRIVSHSCISEQTRNAGTPYRYL